MKPRRISFSLLALCLLVLAAAVSSGCNKQQATAEVGPTAATNAPPAVPAVTSLADSGSAAPKPDIHPNRRGSERARPERRVADRDALRKHRQVEVGTGLQPGGRAVGLLDPENGGEQQHRPARAGQVEVPAERA